MRKTVLLILLAASFAANVSAQVRQTSLSIDDGTGKFVKLIAAALTSSTRTFTFPDATGTVALTSNIGSNAVGGDLSGTVSNATVIKIQGRAVVSTAPANNQALVWIAANSDWEPTTVTTSSAFSAITT